MMELNAIRERLTLSQNKTFPVYIREFGLDITVNEGVLPPQEFENWRWLTVNFLPVGGKLVLEFGCGFALPRLYLAKSAALSVLACDIDPKAVENSLENAVRNRIHNIEVIQSDINRETPSILVTGY
ncbi:50S ribosomal protein L11 methyltransferase [Mesorhizobium sp. VK9D]|uniref:50S ribosomal protein L11 methyltransferase n=1 Tax=Mesorhizobium australafricanum TaxID=3072311 RepID=UPI002A246C65|nr:50S ribosomal protein L11 methyltransferase [Mesorhizobium sp. VK9D]MDX8455303.1 50S ribosomal protein L11 methyltransferase [Mesorhizobium sp. VK9D]